MKQITNQKKILKKKNSDFQAWVQENQWNVYSQSKNFYNNVLTAAAVIMKSSSTRLLISFQKKQTSWINMFFSFENRLMSQIALTATYC